MLMVRRIFSIPERIIPLVVLALATAFATSPAMATLPGPTSVTFAKGVKFAVAGYAGASTLSGFPVLVRIAENSPSGFSYDDLQSKSTGADIAFVDMDGNGIPFEIDTWNTSGTSLIWVRLPSMTNGTEFVMCWGSVTSGKTVCPANPWSDFTGVWHMGDPGDGVTNVCDSTANRLDGTTVASSKAEPAGKIGGARFITSNTSNTAGNPYDSGVTVDLPGDKLAAVNSIVPEFTASFWVRPQHGPQWWYSSPGRPPTKDRAGVFSRAQTMISGNTGLTEARRTMRAAWLFPTSQASRKDRGRRSTRCGCPTRSSGST